MKALPRALRFIVVILAGLLSAGILAVCVVLGVYLYFGPQLPQAGDIGNLQFNEPLRVYTADHKLIGEFGKQRRLPRTYDQIPHQLVQAFVAAEDDRFWQHPGIDYQGLTRAVIHLIKTGRKTQGGSTITMQLARNLYLSRDRTYVRKIKEMILALRLESKLSKQQIMALYLNKIYLGERAYGVAAAARVYYGKPLAELNLAQMAMIAGLPKAPSLYNPLANPERAKQRRQYVLSRMHALGMIDDAAYQKARAAGVSAAPGADESDDNSQQAAYVAEMVRRAMRSRYGDKAYTQGYKVTTTIDSRRQRAADRALRRDLLAYDARHAWHGPEKTLDDSVVDNADALKAALADMNVIGDLVPAVVTAVANRSITLATANYGEVELRAGDIPWLKRSGSARKLVAADDVVRLAYTGSGNNQKAWTLAEIPKIEGAMVALDPDTGAIEALVGGFDFAYSKFNRAVQARRQPGSAFKPFLYSAALANGFTPASLINDAPVVYHNAGPQKDWRPQNYGHHIRGPTRLREGLVHSLNLVSVRLLRAIGVNTAIDYAARFGLPKKQMPRDLSLALGSASFSPLQMAAGYAVFANGGYRVEPYFISKIAGRDGKPVYRAKPKVACANLAHCPPLSGRARASAGRLAARVITADNAYIVGDMMRDVIRRGTGVRAKKLDRSDLSGKTGTTNDQVDAWFGGFNANLVAISWAGFDKPKPMGHHETGAHAALPMWIDFMRGALAGKPEARPAKPANLRTVKIDPKTGQRALNGHGIAEIFRPDKVPTKAEARRSGPNAPANEVEQLF